MEAFRSFFPFLFSEILTVSSWFFVCLSLSGVVICSVALLFWLRIFFSHIIFSFQFCFVRMVALFLFNFNFFFWSWNLVLFYPSNQNATQLIINPSWLPKFCCCLLIINHFAFASSLILFWIFKFMLLLATG